MMNKKNILLYIIIFCIGIIFTYPAFPISHALDSFCTICNGYTKTASWFLQIGRPFSYLFYNLFDLIKLPYNSLGYISVFIGDAILSLTIIILYYKILEKNKSNNNIYKIILLICIFLLYFNPLYTSILLLDEAFVIDLGIFFLTIASIYLLKDGMINKIISLLMTILGIMCYQGIASYLFVSLILLIISDKEKRNNIIYIIKKIITSTLFYGISFIINYIFINLICNYYNVSTPKIGEFSLKQNIEYIITKLIPTSTKYMFGFVNTKYYYLLTIISLIIILIYIIKNKKRINKLITLVILIVSCMLIPFVPNIFMSSSSNYTDARMALTLGILPNTLIIYLISYFKFEKRGLYALIILSCCISFISFHSIHQNMMIDLKRYKYDMKYITKIKSEIKYYENKNDKKVNYIYYAKDTSVDYYYNFGNANGANIRINAIDWAFECAIKSIMERDITLNKMDEEKYNELFENINYDKVEDEQFIFENDKLYLLIY